MRVIQIVPVLAILTATVLVASLFAFSVVGSVDAKLPTEELKAITLIVERVDIVHTDDLGVKEVMTVVTGPISFNLLDLRSGIVAGLGIPTIDDGVVTQFRLVVTEATITFNGVTFLLKIPADVVRFNGVVSVPGQDAVFEFDAEKSVISNKGQGCCKLKPVLKFEST